MKIETITKNVSYYDDGRRAVGEGRHHHNKARLRWLVIEVCALYFLVVLLANVRLLPSLTLLPAFVGLFLLPQLLVDDCSSSISFIQHQLAVLLLLL
jgi:hypothetical protein